MAKPEFSGPRHVENMLIGKSNSIQLRVKVSDKVGIRQYGFAFDGVPVPMSHGQGMFFAPPGQIKLLEWVMRGDAGGTMKVTVTRDGKAIKEREKSTIPPPFGEGYDALEIEVS